MPDYGIEVEVGPDASGFPAALRRELEQAEARSGPVQVEVEPKLSRDFSQKVRRDTQKALERLDAKVEVEAKLSSRFRQNLQRDLNRALAAMTVGVEIEPKVGRSFRADLRRELTRAAAGVRVSVEVEPKVGASFRRDLQRELERATAGVTIRVPIEPTLTRRVRADLQRSLDQALRGRPLEVPVRLVVNRAALDRLRRELAARELDVRVRADTSSARREILSLGGLGGRVGSLLRTGLLAGMAGLGALLVTAFAGAAVAGANFEAQLSSLQAVSAVTAGELGQLRQQALDAGAATVFSATEAAEAQTELSKAGASTAQILGGGLTAALDLAAAGEIGLADAATFVATGLNTFALGADEAGRVADVLSAAANRSATDIPQMGYALSQSGLVAKQFGLSIEETSGVLAVFAQNGLTGSDAGTSFRTMLQRLNPQSEKAAGVMRDLGLEFYDSEGAFVGITDAASQLQDKLGGLTEEQRAAAIQTIFGADAARAANIVFEAGGAGIADWTAQVTDSGNAAETAATKLDNLKGDVEGLKGAFETVFIEAGSASSSGLRDVVQSLTEVVNQAGPSLVAALEPVADLITDITPEIGGLFRVLGPVLESFGELAGPIAAELLRFLIVVLAYFGDLFTTLGPLGDAVVTVLRAFEPLVPVLAEIASTVLLALVPGLDAIADPSVGSALGDLAVAFGEILVAVAPLLPVLVRVMVSLAEQGLPVLEALVPVITAVVSILGPMLEDLAQLAPVILLAVALSKFVGWIRTALTAMSGFGTQLQGIRTRLVNTFGEQAGAQVFRGLVSAAYVAGAAVSGYMAGAAEDSTTAILSIATAASSIALAFAAGGPVAGAFAVGAALLGNFFGRAQKEARAAAAEQKAYNAQVASLRDAFNQAGVGRDSTDAQRQLVVAGEFLETMKGQSREAGFLKTALNNLKIPFETLVQYAAEGESGMDGLNEAIDRAVDRKADFISEDAVDRIRDYGRFTDLAKDSALQLADQLQSTYATTANRDALTQGIVGFTRDVENGTGSLTELAIVFGDATDGAIGLTEITEQYRDLIAQEIGDSPVVTYLRSLPQATRDALVEQERLARVQGLIADETDAARAAAERYSSAYDEVTASVDLAADAYERWVQQQQGAEPDLASIRLGVVDFARQVRELGSDESLSAWEKQQRQIQLTAQAQTDASEAFAIFAQQSGGNYDVFAQKVEQFRLETIGGLMESLNIGSEEAAALADQIIATPSAEAFVTLDTEAAVQGLTDVQDGIRTYIGGTYNASLALSTAQPEDRMAVMNYILEGYRQSNPQAFAYLNSLSAEDKARALQEILDGLDGRHVQSTVDLLLNLSPRDRAIAERYMGQAALGEYAAGGLIERPEVALIGEAGPELILPLTDPERVRALLAEHAALLPGLAAAASGAPAGAGVAAPGPLEGSPGVTIPVQAEWIPNLEPLTEWVEGAVVLMVTLGQRLTDEALPVALVWEAQMVELFVRLSDAMTLGQAMMLFTATSGSAQMVALATMTGETLVAIQTSTGDRLVAVQAFTMARAQAELSAGLGAMTTRAAAGGAGIVGALSAALGAGTAAVKVIVVGYRGELVGALNPILSAVGAQPIALARGGYVPGDLSTTSDTIDARLMTGEYVLTRAMAREAGIDRLEAWRRDSNRRRQGYAEGGPVVGDTQGLHPEFARRLDTWAVAQNAVFRVESGYRSIAEQARLYQAYLAGVPGQAQAAPPGSSMHNFGLAADGSRWRDRNPGAFGLRYPMSYEPWHVEPTEAKKWAALMPDGGLGGAGATWGPLPQPAEAGAYGLLSLAGGETMQRMYDAALEWAGSIVYDTPGDLTLGGSGPAREALARLWIQEAIKLTGVPSSWLNGLLTIARRESGFDPTAINLWDSNASKGQPSQGLMQTIPATFDRYKLPGLGGITNPVANVVAAIRYILDRYGDISRVQQANPLLPPKGYAEGGPVLADGTASAMARFDTASMAEQLRRAPTADAPAPGRRGGVTIEGDVKLDVNVTPPDAQDPESYGMALGHRAAPLLAAVLRRGFPGA